MSTSSLNGSMNMMNSMHISTRRHHQDVWDLNSPGLEHKGKIGKMVGSSVGSSVKVHDLSHVGDFAMARAAFL